MSAYTDSIQAYAQGKSSTTAAASSTSSVFSETSYYKEGPTSSGPKQPKSPKTKSLKSWTKELISDIGKPPTYRYDTLNESTSSSSTTPKHYETNAVGAPSWDNRPTKI